MRTFLVSRPSAWWLIALLSVMCALWGPVAVLMQPVLHEAAAARSIDRERMTADFAAALTAWAAHVQRQASTADAAWPLRDAAPNDVLGAMTLQARLMAAGHDDASSPHLRGLLETRAEVAAARDLVVQLRMAGEARRADVEYASRLQPAVGRLAVDVEQLTRQARAATDAHDQAVRGDARRATHAMQLIFAVGLIALLVAVRTTAWTTAPTINAPAWPGQAGETAPAQGAPASVAVRPAEVALALLSRTRRDGVPLSAGEHRTTAAATSDLKTPA